MRTVSFLICLLFSSAVLAQPEINTADLERTVQRILASEALYWNPFPFPYEIAQESKDKDALFLQKLYDYGLVEREELMVPTAMAQGRPQYEKRWRYEYNAGRNPHAPEGFYYGRGQLIKVLEVSQPILTKGTYYIQLRVQWSVNHLQDWAQDVAFKQARTLRRSQQSQSQPFERELLLQYQPIGEYWELWQEPEF